MKKAKKGFNPDKRYPAHRVVSREDDGEYCLQVYPREDQSVFWMRTEKTPRHIALKDIFDAVADGTVARQFPELTKKDITLCHAFLATNVPEHESYRRNNRGRKISILFDEQLPYGLVPALTRELPNLSHVYLEGLSGYADEFIYNRPWYQLKERESGKQLLHRQTKYVIISRDQDLTDLARAQWMARISATRDPESIDFDDVNVVFHVKDSALTNVDGAPIYAQFARDIMRAAYSGAAASYTIGENGIAVERGSSRESLIELVETDFLANDHPQGLSQERIFKTLIKKAGRKLTVSDCMMFPPKELALTAA